MRWGGRLLGQLLPVGRAHEPPRRLSTGPETLHLQQTPMRHGFGQLRTRHCPTGRRHGPRPGGDMYLCGTASLSALIAPGEEQGALRTWHRTSLPTFHSRVPTPWGEETPSVLNARAETPWRGRARRTQGPFTRGAEDHCQGVLGCARKPHTRTQSRY